MSSNAEVHPERRLGTDRRAEPTRFWWSIWRGGCRLQNRRTDEHVQHHFVDKYCSSVLVLVALLLGLTVVDGVLTLVLLDTGCSEMNPVLRYLLGRGISPFFIGKYLLTAAGLPVLVAFKNYPLLGTRFRVGYLLPVFVGLYCILLGYQLWLLIVHV